LGDFTVTSLPSAGNKTKKELIVWSVAVTFVTAPLQISLIDRDIHVPMHSCIGTRGRRDLRRGSVPRVPPRGVRSLFIPNLVIAARHCSARNSPLLLHNVGSY